jgi:hypothetical protein
MSRLKDGRLVIIADLGDRTSHDNWPMLTHWQKPDRGMSNHLFWSSDNGRTWSEPEKIDDIGGEPSYIIELSDGTLVFTRTESATSPEIIAGPMPWGNIYYKNTAVFSDDGGVLLTAGLPVYIDRDGVRLGARRAMEESVDAAGSRIMEAASHKGGDGPAAFALDTSKWHRYRLVREGRMFSIFVDGELKLKTDTARRDTRIVNFASSGESTTGWRAVRARIENPQDLHAVVDWRWDPAKGFPDQFRRNRVVRLDTSADSGYSGWAQLAGGDIVIVDYTNEHPHKNASRLGPQPFIRAYLVNESCLTRDAADRGRR